ncbi:response regulator transcription factor [Clostridium sp. HV4-5-A1G]|uniref:response regulator transcription factor n=1 Tax=Clostridium sp. HV4-5-A1G TaxID=2004595 RepID=UPI00123B1EB2|nr:response regulator transcription factor [Clostridium sp. HV4-5-A1G]KAA8674833.1 response regulator transcription factor [Clostridium sp. HV4-5-A1G]
MDKFRKANREVKNLKQVEIMIVEDDDDINKILELIVKEQGYKATCCFSGTEARLRLQQQSFDLILLDIMLPGLTGEELLGEIREHSSVPVIVVSAKNMIEDKVSLLRLGADDYMVKPFAREEVAARIEVQLRKNYSRQADKCLNWKALTLDEGRHVVMVEKSELNLTNVEFDILKIMLKHPKQVFSKAKLYELLWNDVYRGNDNSISVHVSNIRKKIAAVTNEEYIKTIWGIGFSLV